MAGRLKARNYAQKHSLQCAAEKSRGTAEVRKLYLENRLEQVETMQ